MIYSINELNSLYACCAENSDELVMQLEEVQGNCAPQNGSRPMHHPMEATEMQGSTEATALLLPCNYVYTAAPPAARRMTLSPVRRCAASTERQKDSIA